MIRSTKIHEYLQFLKNSELPVKALLAQTGISQKKLADPDYLIDVEQLEALVMNLIRLTKHSDLAFKLGEYFDPTRMGIIGYALLSSRNLRDAMRLWHQYSNPLLGSPLRLVVADGKDLSWTMTVIPMSRQAQLQRFFIEEFLVSGTKLFRLLATQPPVFRSLSFGYSKPPHHALYRKKFDCPIRFDAAATVFEFRSPSLDTPIRSNDQELNAIVSEYCGNVLRQLPRKGTSEARIRSLFLTTPGTLPTKDDAAKYLGFSRSTLNRRLKENEHSYGNLKQEFRLDLAKQYLASGHMTVKQIGHFLGFTSPSAFCRAFKHWTGTTPGQHRAQAYKITRSARDNNG